MAHSSNSGFERMRVPFRRASLIVIGPYFVWHWVVRRSSIVFETVMLFMPRVVVSWKMISFRASSFSGEHRTETIVAGRDFFMVVGMKFTSFAPAEISLSMA